MEASILIYYMYKSCNIFYSVKYKNKNNTF